MKKRLLFILPALAIMASCKPDIKDEINSNTYYPGEADFTTYVAIGNSLTSGYMDGSMFKSGQEFSFPNILAGQFKTVGGGEFTQPSFADDAGNAGGLLLQGKPLTGFETKLIFNPVSQSPERYKKESTIEVTDLQKKAYHNAGVPGAKSFHLLADGYGSLTALAAGKANPYFVRTATNEGTSVMKDAMSLNPTFFTNWIGSNDVLAYAMSGGEGKDQNKENGLDPSQYGPNDITHIGVFKNVYEQITNTLTANGAKGVVATIPYVTTIPYFTTVPYAPVTAKALEDKGIDVAKVVPLLNMLFTNLEKATGSQGRFKLFDATRPNAVLIQDKTLTGDFTQQIAAVLTQINNAGVLPAQLSPLHIAIFSSILNNARHATNKDLLVLTSRSEIGAPPKALEGLVDPAIASFLATGVIFPLEDKFVLNPTEQATIKEATDTFNMIIKTVAQEKGLAVADMNYLLNEAVRGLRVDDGSIYTADFFNGSNLNTVMFSMDGVHLNAKGYAFVASEIIKVINRHYNSKIPLVNPAVYPGVPMVIQ